MMSPKQTQIYYELISGKSYKEISEKFFISTETVKTHCRAIYQFFEVTDQKKLMGLVIQLQDTPNPEAIKTLANDLAKSQLFSADINK